MEYIALIRILDHRFTKTWSNISAFTNIVVYGFSSQELATQYAIDFCNNTKSDYEMYNKHHNLNISFIILSYPIENKHIVENYYKYKLISKNPKVYAKDITK